MWIWHVGAEYWAGYTRAIMRIIAVFFAVMGVALPSVSFASEMLLDPTQQQYNWLDTFIIPLRLETNGECINAVSGVIQYDPARVSVIDVARGSSIITLWTEPPTIDAEAGEVRFSGGVPGGYCGRIAGDPGFTNMLLELVVTGAQGDPLIEAAETSFGIIKAEVLLNDGSGTPAPVSTRGTSITLSPSSAQPTDQWQGHVNDDTVAPELFEILLANSPEVAGGRYFIAFNTTDKQSGVDHFEVLETDPSRFGFLSWTPRRSHWVEAKSPYILRDQKLRSKIMVKAVDNAGNERVVEYTPSQPLLAEVSDWRVIALIVLIGVLTFGVYLLLGYMKRRRIAHLLEDNHQL